VPQTDAERQVSTEDHIPERPIMPPPYLKKDGWKGSISGLVAVFGMLGMFLYLMDAHDASVQRAVIEQDNIGKPKLGGDFELTGSDGSRVKSTDYLGKYVILYFGFRMCPDVCPVEMEKVAEVMEYLDEKFGADLVVPMFVSVDPRRDKPKDVGEYVAEFHPKYVGLTGTEEEIKNVTRMFRVYYNPGVKSGEEDYLVDHSIIHYLVDKSGQFREFYGKNLTPMEMAKKIEKHILKDKEASAKRAVEKAKGVSDA